jgi:hypothetical protein
LVDSGKSDSEVAELLHTSWLTVLRTRQICVEGGLDFALNELPWAGRLPKIDDNIEMILTTLAQSQPLNGHVHWTLHRLVGGFNGNEFIGVRIDDTLFHALNYKI